MMTNTSSIVTDSYRRYYGKLFSALFGQFGVKYVTEIEDAIQNSFLKSLKSWKPSRIPKNKENWLFIVARNDLLNQIKKQNRLASETHIIVNEEAEHPFEDLRLGTILFLAKSKHVSYKAKVLFILKNIFGLHVKEISEATLLSQEAIYKSINRAKKGFGNSSIDGISEFDMKHCKGREVNIAEEILYAVFNIGFDSFNEKVKTIVNEDLCLEALALAKIVSDKFQQISTKNLLALFSFHLARIPAKVQNDRIVSFFEQDKRLWSTELIKLGFHYLEKPKHLDKYYLESLIASKHMMATEANTDHWDEIITLYELLISLTPSAIIKLNLCYCLNKVNRTEEAMDLLQKVEKELPSEHIYFSLVKANLSKNSNTSDLGISIDQVLKNIKQEIRRTYILENMTKGF